VKGCHPKGWLFFIAINSHAASITDTKVDTYKVTHLSTHMQRV